MTQNTHRSFSIFVQWRRARVTGTMAAAPIPHSCNLHTHCRHSGIGCHQIKSNLKNISSQCRGWKVATITYQQYLKLTFLRIHNIMLMNSLNENNYIILSYLVHIEESHSAMLLWYIYLVFTNNKIIQSILRYLFINRWWRKRVKKYIFYIFIN